MSLGPGSRWSGFVLSQKKVQVAFEKPLKLGIRANA